MAKLIVFSAIGFNGTSKEFRSNDPDLVQNGDDFVVSSAIAIEGDWTLFHEPGFAGTSIGLSSSGGPDSDGTYKDSADWDGTGEFHVKSIQHS
ncbi:MAG: beta/gamma crystallin-related protein [Pyrinomonadaceae bacterium]